MKGRVPDQGAGNTCLDPGPSGEEKDVGKEGKSERPLRNRFLRTSHQEIVCSSPAAMEDARQSDSSSFRVCHCRILIPTE